MSVAVFATLIITAASLLLMLLRPRGLGEVWWVGGGAITLLALHLAPLSLGVHAIGESADVCLFLTGMMLLSALARAHGVFDWLASVVLSHAHGSAARLFSLVYVLGVVVTVCLSNDATAVVLTPAIFAATGRARPAVAELPPLDPLPYLFACALVANAASFVLPIANPANLVVFHSGLPPLGSWLAAFALPSALSIVTTFVVLRWRFRDSLRTELAEVARPGALPTTGRLVLAGLALVVATLLAASALHRNLGLPTLLAALIISAAVSLVARANPLPLLAEISWSTLPLVAGLFVLVRAVEAVGALRLTIFAATWLQSLSPAASALAAGFTAGIANNLVNNLPLGLLAGTALHTVHAHGLLADAVLIGVDLGPNLSVTGSLATILWLLALRRENLHVSALDFLRIGVVAMPAALLAALLGALAVFRLHLVR